MHRYLGRAHAALLAALLLPVGGLVAWLLAGATGPARALGPLTLLLAAAALALDRGRSWSARAAALATTAMLLVP
jgi:uncharacterized membrane protein (UPF0136 family)